MSGTYTATTIPRKDDGPAFGLDGSRTTTADIAGRKNTATAYTFDRMTRPSEFFTSYSSGTEFAGQFARPFALPVFRILEAVAEASDLLTHAVQAIESMSKFQWNDAETGYHSAVHDEDGEQTGAEAGMRAGLKNNLLDMAHNVVGNFDYKDDKGTLDDSGIIRKLVAAVASFITEALAFITKGVTTLTTGVYKGGAYAMNSMFACCKPGDKAGSASVKKEEDASHNTTPLSTKPMSMTHS
jgi:hypothetical protein